MSVGLTFPRAVRSEWIKLRTLRSTWITYAVAILVTDGLGLLITGLHGREEFHRGAPTLDQAATFSLHAIMFAQLAIGVLGVLFVTGEYATGMIRASMTAEPRRTSVLAAKALVFGSLTALLSLAMTFGSFFLSQLILSQWHYDVALSSPGAVRAIFGAALYLTVVGPIGIGLGFAIRNTGGAIATLFGLILVLPLLVQALPSSWQDDIAKFLPLSIAIRMISQFPEPGSHALSNAWGAAALVAYAVVALVVGWIVLKRKDV